MEADRSGAQWEAMIQEVISGLRDWRAAHPHATFAEIEAAVDERLDRVRARMVEDSALASRAAELSGRSAAERPRWPECGELLEARGQHERTLTVRGNQPVRLKRSYAVCPTCGVGHFPPG